MPMKPFFVAVGAESISPVLGYKHEICGLTEQVQSFVRDVGGEVSYFNKGAGRGAIFWYSIPTEKLLSTSTQVTSAQGS